MVRAIPVGVHAGYHTGWINEDRLGARSAGNIDRNDFRPRLCLRPSNQNGAGENYNCRKVCVSHGSLQCLV